MSASGPDFNWLLPVLGREFSFLCPVLAILGSPCKSEIGVPCQADDECSTKWCYNSKCFEPLSDGERCYEDVECVSLSCKAAGNTRGGNGHARILGDNNYNRNKRCADTKQELGTVRNTHVYDFGLVTSSNQKLACPFPLSIATKTHNVNLEIA